MFSLFSYTQFIMMILMMISISKIFIYSRQGVTPPALGESCDVFLKNWISEESLLECPEKSSENQMTHFGSKMI